jgi:hypothetical protein
VTAVEPAAPVAPTRWAKLTLAGVLVFGALIVVLHVDDYTRVSPTEELQHYDYVVRVVRDHELVRRGDHFVEESLETEACQGLDADFPIPRCGKEHYRASDFQEGGYNTAYIHQPVYYAVTGFLADAMSGIVGSDSLFTTGRLVGVLWMGGALALSWLAMAELGIAWERRIAPLVLLACAPTVMEATATINPDATAMLAGAAVLLAVLRWERGGRWWPAALAATLAVAFKSTNILGLGLGLLYVIVRHLQQGRDTRWGTADRDALRRSLWVVGGMLAGAGAIALVWVAYSSSVALVPTLEIPMAARYHVDSITLSDVLRNLTTGFTPIDGPYIPSELRTVWIAPIATLVDRLFLVGIAVAAYAAPVRSRIRALAIATLGACLLVGPVFVVANFVLQGTYVDIPRRYGLALMPALAVGVTSLLTEKRLQWVATAGSVLVGLATLSALIG